MMVRLISFLVINFGALGLGSLITKEAVISDWYKNLNKAPWTPPGWVFGAAWTSIMVLFAIYMSYLWTKTENKTLLVALFVFQWILNVCWNPIFFYFHYMSLSLVVISALTVLMGYFLFENWAKMGFKSALVAPYFIWLLIATSLNLYTVLYN